MMKSRGPATAAVAKPDLGQFCPAVKYHGRGSWSPHCRKSRAMTGSHGEYQYHIQWLPTPRLLHRIPPFLTGFPAHSTVFLSPKLFSQIQGLTRVWKSESNVSFSLMI